MNIQYCHVRKFKPEFNLMNFTYESKLEARGGETIAMQEVQVWFAQQLKPGDFFTKSVGKARCSDDENYNKKTGRDIATSRMKAVTLTVISNEDFGGVRRLVLTDTSGNAYLLEKRINHNKVHFVGYE